MPSKILIIENDETTRLLISQKLKKEGYEVLDLNNWVEGLSIMNEFKPDLVLLEMDLPQFAGFDMLEEMRKSSVLRRIPVITIVSPSWRNGLDRLSEAGVRDWLMKTEFDPQELLEKVDRCIKK